jgi:hypothetical protein
VTEPDRTAAGPAELAGINQRLGRLVGQPCWHLGFSYGDELCAHFGEKLTYGSGPLVGNNHGEWELGTRASQWVLRDPAGTPIASSDVGPSAARRSLDTVAGRRVSSAIVSLPDLDLRIAFDGGEELEVSACQDGGPGTDEGDPGGDVDEAEIACWELVDGPGGQIVQVWPGPRWSVGQYPRT